MAEGKRRYDQACGSAHALDILGERWALLVVRELLLGPKRFAEIRAGLPGVSANVLSQRLDGLEDSGVLTKRLLPPPASVSIYELTPWGYRAEPILLALADWGTTAPEFRLSRPMSPTTLMLSLRAWFDPARGGKERARVGFRLGSEEFLVLLDCGTLTMERRPPTSADFVFEGSPNKIALAIYAGADLTSIKVEGDVALAKRFVTFFARPARA